MVMQSLIALDQFLNTLYKDGFADETISARCWRMRHLKEWRWKLRLIDWVALNLFNQSGHCYNSFLSELNSSHLPREYHVQKQINDLKASIGQL